MGFTRDDTGLLVMPMCHANSLFFSHRLRYLGAACCVYDARASTPSTARTLAHERMTFTSLVPTHYIMMLGAARGHQARATTSAASTSC